MPAYERPEYIFEAISSALTQTHDNFVLLIGDNSVSNDVKKVVESFSDKRIHYHKNSPGLGAQGNWLDLVSKAQTPLVATLHDDDIWEPEFLAKTVPLMLEDPGISMVFSDYWIIDSKSIVSQKKSKRTTKWHHRDKLKPGKIEYTLSDGIRIAAVWNSPQPAYAAVIRVDDIKTCEFPEETWPLYDIWLSYHLVKNYKGLYYRPERLTKYRIHENSLTSKSFSASEDSVFQLILDQNPDLEVHDEIVVYWSKLRWARSTKLMLEQDGRASSQFELSKAYNGLRGIRKMAAWLGSRSPIVWHAMKLIKKYKGSTNLLFFG